VTRTGKRNESATVGRYRPSACSNSRRCQATLSGARIVAIAGHCVGREYLRFAAEWRFSDTFLNRIDRHAAALASGALRRDQIVGCVLRAKAFATTDRDRLMARDCHWKLAVASA
jgi:hypothetical protein